MACPVHYVEYEEGCKACENEVRRLMQVAIEQGFTMPIVMKWKDKVSFIRDYDLELHDDPIVH